MGQKEMSSIAQFHRYSKYNQNNYYRVYGKSMHVVMRNSLLELVQENEDKVQELIPTGVIFEGGFPAQTEICEYKDMADEMLKDDIVIPIEEIQLIEVFYNYE